MKGVFSYFYTFVGKYGNDDKVLRPHKLVYYKLNHYHSITAENWLFRMYLRHARGTSQRHWKFHRTFRRLSSIKRAEVIWRQICKRINARWHCANDTCIAPEKSLYIRPLTTNLRAYWLLRVFVTFSRSCRCFEIACEVFLCLFGCGESLIGEISLLHIYYYYFCLRSVGYVSLIRRLGMPTHTACRM